MGNEIYESAKVLWNYHLMHHKLRKADAIVALGSHDLRVAERAAELYLQGYSGRLVMSGGLGNFTKGMWKESEADLFAAVAVKMGVPEKDILIENKSSNTGENIQFTRQLLTNHGIDVHRIILVQKPYMERRSYATIRKQWPEPDVQVTSPLIAFENYANDEIPINRVINIMVGDLQRIIEYPAKGFQIAQEVPDKVMAAYQALIDAGYDEHLVR